MAVHNPSMKWIGYALVIVIVGAILVFKIAAEMPSGSPLAPAATGPVVQARVVRFGEFQSEWRPHQLILVAVTADGREGQGVIARARLAERNCRIGSPVEARMQGAALVIDTLTCGNGGQASPPSRRTIQPNAP